MNDRRTQARKNGPLSPDTPFLPSSKWRSRISPTAAFTTNLREMIQNIKFSNDFAVDRSAVAVVIVIGSRLFSSCHQRLGTGEEHEREIDGEEEEEEAIETMPLLFSLKWLN